MRRPWIGPLVLLVAVAALAGPAIAQTPSGANNPYNVSWAALNPGNDWAAQVIQSLFPITGTTASPGTSPGTETSVIQQIVGQFTGFVGAIACAFVAYITIMNIHRAAESSRILGQGQSWMFVVRVGFAGIMMFPLGGGFSAGQALVMQGAMAGIGMAKALYANAIQAVGPDAAVIATPMIPGTQQIVAGLIDNELCMDLVNLASGTDPSQANSSQYGALNGSSPLVPIPIPISAEDYTTGGYTTYRYSLSSGDESGDPACGTVTIREPLKNQQAIAGVSIDMAAVQQAVLNNVLNGTIRSGVETVAQNLWQNKTAASLDALETIYTNAASAYTKELTAAAQTTASALNAAVQKNATQERNGTSDLLQGEVQQSTLGWTAAGAYYLEIAKLNAATLSLLSATPVTTSPTYDGIPEGLSYDLAPLEASAKQFMTTLDYTVQSSDGTRTPNGTPQTLTDAKDNASGEDVLSRIFGQMNLTNAVYQKIAGYILPQTQIWTDPFGGLMSLGQMLIHTSLIAMGAAALLSSATVSTGTAVWSALTFHWAAFAATIAGHAFMSFLATPIYTGLLALLVPGLIIAYVLPMIPYVMWMAGVAGWIILVCEAMIAVPLWMLAHMTVGGDGLHGRAVEGWALLFNVVFRPTLMIIGLFLGYFVFDCMSWLIRESFGIAAGFVLQNGWFVSNFIGLGVLLSIFVMTHVVAALASFRMVALLPHHLPRILGFTSANRVDMEEFMQRAAWGPGEQVTGFSSKALSAGSKQFGKRMAQLRADNRRLISDQSDKGGSGSEGMDSTLRAVSSDDADEGED